MSRQIQVTFDARDPQVLSSFWRDALGYVHPGPPGVDLPAGADPLAAWDDFLARAGVPEEQRGTRSAIEDPDGHGPRLFFQQVPEDKPAEIIATLLDALPPGSYLVATHITTEHDPERIGASQRTSRGGGISAQFRDSADFARFAFSGLDLVPPGVVPLPEWRPADNGVRPSAAEVSTYGGVARKP